MKGKHVFKETGFRLSVNKVIVVAALVLCSTSIGPVMAQTQNKSDATVANSYEPKLVDFAPNDANAIIVKGCVVNKDNEPLIGATIILLDKNNNLISKGTATDGFDSQFAIRVSKGTKVRIQYVGYKALTREFNTPEDNLVIKMETDENTEGRGQFWLLESASTR